MLTLATWPFTFLLAAGVLILIAEFPLKYRLTKNFFTKHILNPLLISVSKAALCFAGLTSYNALHDGLSKLDERRNKQEHSPREYYNYREAENTDPVQKLISDADKTVKLNDNIIFRPVHGVEVGNPTLFIETAGHTLTFVLGSRDEDTQTFYLTEGDYYLYEEEIQCDIALDSPAVNLYSFHCQSLNSKTSPHPLFF